MIEPVGPSERNVPVSPQLALRVAIMGGVALVLFAIIFFRLWYLQVLSGSQYRAQAAANQLRVLPIPAPRGEILDRNGQAIASDRVTNAVQIVPTELPPAGHLRIDLYRRLGRVLHLGPQYIEDLVIKGRKALPYADVPIEVDTGYGVLSYLAEHQRSYPGVTQGQISIRNYPYNDLAAQILGYVGLINSNDTGKRYNGVAPGTIVGQYGLEAAYDRYLRGQAGQEKLEVNSLGQYEGTQPSTPPVAGNDVQLTLDLGLEQEGDKALLQGMDLAHSFGNPAPAGAFVAMDPRNGQMLAMGSYPSFDPNEFARPLTQPQYNALISPTNNSPLLNRAIDGLYPTGSTFKPISAMAALEAGIITPSTTMGGGSCVGIGAANQQFCNSGGVNDGNLDLENALRVSEDTYFYEVGAEANAYGNVIQKMAKYLGLGRQTGIDLPGETTNSVVPDRAWRAHQNELETECDNATGQFKGKPKHPPGGCGIANGAPWTIGDNVNLAVGQGDLLATPLQMAVVYSTLANTYINGNGHGVVPVPHLAEQVDDATGRLVQLIQPPPARHVRLNASDLSAVMTGLHDATSQAGGTSADVWAGFPRPVYGKTGTAQHELPNGSYGFDQAWYVCYLPDPVKPIVIAVTIEKGGFGDQAAAPVARLMASEWFGVKKKLVRGTSPTL